MPRFDFICQSCLRETIIYLHPGQERINHINCEHCNSSDTKLMAFYNDQRSQILNLQYQIDELIRRVDRISDVKGELSLPSPNQKAILN